jgi:hypothetical protein
MVDTVAVTCNAGAWTVVATAKAYALLKPRLAANDIPRDFYLAVAASAPVSAPPTSGTDWIEVDYQSYGFLIDGMTTETVYVYPKGSDNLVMEVLRG